MIIDRKNQIEILEYLKSKLELPEHIISLELTIGVDMIPKVTCEFYPSLKKDEDE